MEQELEEHTHILQSLQTKVKKSQLSTHCGGFEVQQGLCAPQPHRGTALSWDPRPRQEPRHDSGLVTASPGAACEAEEGEGQPVEVGGQQVGVQEMWGGESLR